MPSTVTINGEPYKLFLTLGGLEQLEVHFQTQTLSQLSQKLAAIGMQDLPAVVAVLAEGGGNPITYERVLEAKLNPGELMRAVANAILEGLLEPK